tara:strand:+ start:477 stop:845 length:369 start_codon:yes stop_codon:yes gene_type:complete
MSGTIRLYHATPEKNVVGILTEGIKPNFGEVYASTNWETAVKWIGFTRMWSNRIAVIAFDVPKSEVQIGIDHSPIMLNIIGASHEGASFTLNRTVTNREIDFMAVEVYVNPFFNPEMPDPTA